MRTAIAAAILTLALSPAAQATAIKQATLGSPTQRGSDYGRAQYRHISVGARWAKVVIPASGDQGRFICHEVKTGGAGRVLEQRAEVKLPRGGKLVRIDVTRYNRSGRVVTATSRELRIDRTGRRLRLDPRRLGANAAAYAHLRYVFSAGYSAVRHDQPLMVQVTSQLQAHNL